MRKGDQFSPFDTRYGRTVYRPRCVSFRSPLPPDPHLCGCAILMARHAVTIFVMSISYLFPPDDLTFDDSPSRVSPVAETPELLKRTKRNTKAIGDLSELIVAAELTRAGYTVSKPLGDSYRYDLIIDDGVRLSRVQVKTGRLLSNGSIRVACFSAHFHRGGKQRSYRGEIDFIAAFCPQTGEVYLVPESDIVDSVMHLRVAPPVNRQDKRIRWASRYKLA